MSRKYSTSVSAENIQLVNVGEERAMFDPDLPDAHAVMAAICCVSVRYAAKPSLALALLAADLSFKLTAEAYAESALIVDIARHLVRHWDDIVNGHQYVDSLQMAANSTHH